MDCQAARLMLWFSRPHAAEVTADDQAALDQHLASCPACARLARLQAQENRLLGRALRSAPVPPDLQERILARLSAEELARIRAFRGRVVRYTLVASAAALLLTAGVLWCFLRPVPPASLQELDWWTRTRFSLPIAYPAADKIAWLEHYFYSQGLWFRVPAFMKTSWDFAHLSAAYVQEFSRDAIAVIEFKKPGGHAFVFVVPRSRCDPAEVEQYQERSGVPQAYCATDDHVVALVVMKEGALEQFLLPNATLPRAKAQSQPVK